MAWHIFLSYFHCHASPLSLPNNHLSIIPQHCCFPWGARRKISADVSLFMMVTTFVTLYRGLAWIRKCAGFLSVPNLQKFQLLPLFDQQGDRLQHPFNCWITYRTTRFGRKTHMVQQNCKYDNSYECTRSCEELSPQAGGKYPPAIQRESLESPTERRHNEMKKQPRYSRYDWQRCASDLRMQAIGINHLVFEK